MKKTFLEWLKIADKGLLKYPELPKQLTRKTANNLILQIKIFEYYTKNL